MQNKNLSPDKKEMNLLVYAFQNFAQATETLSKSYKALQQKITQLNTELSEANKALSRKVAELNRVRTYLKNILDSMMDGLIVLDLDGKITIFNHSAERITGYKAEDVLGRHYEAIFGKENEEFVSLLKESLDKRTAIIGEKNFFSSEKRIFLEVTANPVKDNDGKTEGVVVVFRDVSLIRYLKDEIQRKKKLAILGEMAASVAHEIRNPLSGIEGFALLLRDNLKEDREKKKWVEHIIKGARSLNNLVNNLLSFSHPLKPDFQFIMIDQIIESTLTLIQQKIQKEKIAVSMVKKFSSHPVKIVGDPDLLRQAFLNLMLNAVEAMPGGGKLSILVKVDSLAQATCQSENKKHRGITCNIDRDVIVEISDTGHGIAPENISRIFHPFFTTKSKGCGLGLAIVQQIVESHGGKIRVRSKPGEGTTFILHLPLANNPGRVEDGSREYSYSG